MSGGLTFVEPRLPARTCGAARSDGLACGMAPLRDSEYCFAHDPEHADEAARARATGGVRRRRERVTAVVYDLERVETIDGIRRLLHIAASDTLGLENSIARSR